MSLHITVGIHLVSPFVSQFLPSFVVVSFFWCPLFPSFSGAVIILCLVVFSLLSVSFSSLVYCSSVILLKFRSDSFTVKDLFFSYELYPNKLVSMAYNILYYLVSTKSPVLSCYCSSSCMGMPAKFSKGQ